MERVGDVLTSLLSASDKKPLSERMKAISDRLAAEAAMTPAERREAQRQRMQERCDQYNRTPGKLKDGYYISTIQSSQTFIPGDGYDCKRCLNRGDTLHVRESGGSFYEYSVPCRCMKVRKSIWRIKKSGLENIIRDCRFDRFESNEPWQKQMLELAHKYLDDGLKNGRWLYYGGQPGSGKTFLCTAVARELIHVQEMDLIYAVWPQISKKLKAIVNEADEYADEVGKLQHIDVLYIDDLFKPVRNDKGEWQLPTAADMKLAFEILNYRYINKLPTIISSERYINEIEELDEATGSRIVERCGVYAMSIGRDKGKNHRMATKMVTEV